MERKRDNGPNTGQHVDFLPALYWSAKAFGATSSYPSSVTQMSQSNL